MTETLAFDEIKEEFLQSLRDGGDPSIDDFVKSYPEHSEEIHQLFPTIRLVERLEKEDARRNLNDELLSTHGTEFDDYSVLGTIGRGGTSIVYEAEQKSLNRRVALKVLAEPYASSVDQSDRFLQEAYVGAELHHSNIVPVIDLGEENGVFFLAMKLVDGKSLEHLIRSGRCYRSEGKQDGASRPPFPLGDWSAIARLGADAAKALSYAHARGVLHRDVKPGNLLIDYQQRIWITDFGLAKVKNADEKLTKTGYTLGTPRYMAPEQLYGEAGEASDVFGLGVTLYELLTLAPRFENRQRSGRSSKVADPRSINPAIPAELARIVTKACAISPRVRYNSAQELADDLTRFLEDPSAEKRLARERARRRWRLQAVGMILAALLVYLAGRFSVPSQTDSDVPFEDPRRVTVTDASRGVTIVEVPISSSWDDAEEYSDGTVERTSTDLELTWDSTDQTVGLRFIDVEIPKNAAIRKAYVQFYCDEADIGPASLILQGEATDDASPFAVMEFDISQRVRTAAAAHWSPPTWTDPQILWATPAQRTPDCTDVIQEIISRPGWKHGNSLAIIITGTGDRCACAYDRQAELSPVLHVEYAIDSGEE